MAERTVIMSKPMKPPKVDKKPLKKPPVVPQDKPKQDVDSKIRLLSSSMFLKPKKEKKDE